MSRRQLLGLVSRLAIAVWVISACAQAPVAQPTAVEEREAERKPIGELDPEAGMAELKSASLGQGEKLKAVATTNIVAHIVSQVAGEAVELTQLLPIGADPHTYIATPRDVAAVTDAHVVFANGAGLEADFLPELVQDARTPVIQVSSGIQLRESGAAPEQQHEELDDQAGESIDPHTWTTPANVIVFVNNVEQALNALDSANAGIYRANAEAYVAELEALDNWVKTQIQTIPTENRAFVTDHASFGYYADRYGLEQIGAVIPAFSTAAEPSARELAALEGAIREYAAKAVFVGTTVNPALARQVAEDTGTRMVTLYTGSLGPEGSGVETYVAYICHNTIAIVDALGGEATVAGSPCE
jgi:manganese/iron transport system substrate-binding protein